MRPNYLFFIPLISIVIVAPVIELTVMCLAKSKIMRDWKSAFFNCFTLISVLL